MSLIMPNGRPQPPQAPTQGTGGGRSVQDAMGGLRGYAQTKYGKSLSDQDFQSYAQRTGFTGDTVNDDQYRAAEQEIDRAYGGGQQSGQVPGPPKTHYPTPLPDVFQYQPQFAAQVNPMMQKMLANPHTMGQQWQDQQYEAGKEQALDMHKQLGLQASQGLTGRGFSGAGGVNQAIMGDLNQNLMSQLLAGRRDIATQAATQNRQDELTAMQMAQGWDQQGFQNAMGQNQFGLQRWLAGTNADLEYQQFGEGQRQFDKGFGLDFMRFLENQKQFQQQFGEGKRQYDNTMGLNWFNAQVNQQNNFLNWLGQYGF
jgi:hypothetical protein